MTLKHIDPKHIFKNTLSDDSFNEIALDLFQFQALENEVYKAYIKLLGINSKSIKHYSEIPFFPVELFKTHTIIAGNKKPQLIFSSSGTSGQSQSKHSVVDLSIYEQSFTQSFESFYGPITDYCILALLPSYLERDGSSLIYMMNHLIKKSSHPESGFYLNEYQKLNDTILQLEANKQKTLLVGVSFALLDFIESFSFNLKHTIIMETGGMKGKRKELIRQELHEKLIQGFGVENIHSEYGMTELLSQAYSLGNGIFSCPPWMKILISDPSDPLGRDRNRKSGRINIIDLANIFSCAFIGTQDIGKTHSNGSFEVLGRFDNSDIRGCNLLIE